MGTGTQDTFAYCLGGLTETIRVTGRDLIPFPLEPSWVTWRKFSSELSWKMRKSKGEFMIGLHNIVYTVNYPEETHSSRRYRSGHCTGVPMATLFYVCRGASVSKPSCSNISRTDLYTKRLPLYSVSPCNCHSAQQHGVALLRGHEFPCAWEPTQCSDVPVVMQSRQYLYYQLWRRKLWKR